MRNNLFTITVLLLSTAAQAHHWVKDVYDSKQRFIAEVEVREFRLIHPHPLMLVEIKAIRSEQIAKGIETGQTWTLEMDNKRELTALGLHAETFVPGDTILVALDPSRTSHYRENTLYLRAAEHSREGFIYLHNVRELFATDSENETLTEHLHRIQ